MPGIWFEEKELKKKFDEVQVLIAAKKRKPVSQAQTLETLLDFWLKNHGDK